MKSTWHPDLLEEITTNLEPFKAGKTNAWVKAQVESTLRVIGIIASLPSSDQAQNRRHARQLKIAVVEVIGLLKSAPIDLAFEFRMGRPILVSDDRTARLPQPDEWEAAVRNGTDQLVDQLNVIRRVCEEAEKTGIGRHWRTDPLKDWCAREAYGLMQVCSDGKIVGTVDAPYRTISELLYEAISGEKSDLKRACDAVLREQPRS